MAEGEEEGASLSVLEMPKFSTASSLRPDHSTHSTRSRLHIHARTARRSDTDIFQCRQSIVPFSALNRHNQRIFVAVNVRGLSLAQM